MIKRWFLSLLSLLFCSALTAAHQELSLLTFNICFLPGSYPLQYGGVTEAAARVERVADFILKANADVVVLQEAHDLKATKKLAGRLKKSYPHLIFNIGKADKILNSGLLIASKYKLECFDFKPFSYDGMQYQINKGFAHFKVVGQGGRPLAYLFATHLQPGTNERDREIRELELQEVTQALKARWAEGGREPFILLGDLNIPWGTKEHKLSSLSSFYVDPYTAGIKELNLANLTATDYLTDYMQGRVDEQLLQVVLEDKKGEGDSFSNPYREILDYIVLYSGDTSRHFLVTERLEAFHFESPLEAISDHHALRSVLFSR